MTTITSTSGATLLPELVMGYSSAREGGAVIHEILGRADPDVTLRVKATRTGTLSLLFLDEAQAAEAEAELSGAATFTLNTGGDRPTVDMSFIASGVAARTLDEDTLTVWVVDVDYREILP